MGIAQWSWAPLFQGLGNFPAIKDMLTKERASDSYSITAFFVAKVLCEVPVSLVLPLFFFLICYPMVGLAPQYALPLFLVTCLNVQVALSLSMLISVLVMDNEKSIIVAIAVMCFE